MNCEVNASQAARNWMQKPRTGCTKPVTFRLDPDHKELLCRIAAKMEHVERWSTITKSDALRFALEFTYSELKRTNGND